MILAAQICAVVGYTLGIVAVVMLVILLQRQGFFAEWRERWHTAIDLFGIGSVLVIAAALVVVLPARWSRRLRRFAHAAATVLERIIRNVEGA